MVSRHKWSSALSKCRSKPMHGSKSMGVWSTTSRIRLKCTQSSIGAERVSREKGSAMSVQFGRWNFDGRPVDRDYLAKAKASIAPYGPDDAGSYSKSNISILYHAFHTTKESRREMQPQVTASGAILTWDGRLDNRADLIRQLPDVVTIVCTDVAIVAAAYEYWGKDCFAMFIGDWALSIW